MTTPPLLLVDGRPPTRVLLVRALAGIGDLLTAGPAWRAVRAALPDAEMLLLGLPSLAPVVERMGVVDRLVPFEGWPGIGESPTRDPAAIAEGLRRLQAEDVDLAIQMQGSGVVTNPMTAMSGARALAGFYLPGQWCPDPSRFLPYPAHLPEVRRHLALTAALGAPEVGEDLPFRLEDGDRRAAAGLLTEGGVHRPYAVLHPGATAATRRWPVERFAVVADHLADAGLPVVLTGTEEDRDATTELAARTGAKVLDLAGRTSLGALGAVVSGAVLVVTNDTGTSHLAAALRVPSVVVFLRSDPHRWASLDAERHRAVAAGGRLHADEASECGCEQRCLRGGCRFFDDAAREPEVPSVDAVLAAVGDQLRRWA